MSDVLSGLDWARRGRRSLYCDPAGLERLTSALEEKLMLAGTLSGQHFSYMGSMYTYFWRRLRRLSMILSLKSPTIWQASPTNIVVRALKR